MRSFNTFLAVTSFIYVNNSFALREGHSLFLDFSLPPASQRKRVQFHLIAAGIIKQPSLLLLLAPALTF